MWSSRLFWKLFLSFSAVSLLTIALLLGILSARQQRNAVARQRQRLAEAAERLEAELTDELADGNRQALQQHVVRCSRLLGLRITVVNTDGTVLAESTCRSLREVAELENHRDRIEFVQAASRGQGASERFSATLGSRLLYTAVRVDRSDGPVGFIRTSASMDRMRLPGDSVRGIAVPAVTGAILVSAMVSWFLAARMVTPLRRLTEAAEKMARGRYEPPSLLPAPPELQDLTESFDRMIRHLQRRESALRDSTERLSTVLEGMAEGVIALDDRDRILLANTAAGRLLNFSPASVQGRPLVEVVRSRSVHDAIAQGSGQEGHSTETAEIEFGEEDEQVRRISLQRITLSSETETRCILVLHDVTELRRLESVRREFVANVSHELRTPLSSIQAYTETLLSGALDDDANRRRFLERIDEQAQRLQELIQDLLSIARIESGRQEYHLRDIRLHDLAGACVRDRQQLADRCGVRLQMEDGGDDVCVKADDSGLRQILDNLISNAIQYTPEGGRVTVGCRQRPTAADREAEAELWVADTGIGIPPEDLPRVFERFYRVERSRSRHPGGTGLGLAIVRHLVQAFGGTVEVTSKPGQGTRFLVRLPAV